MVIIVLTNVSMLKPIVKNKNTKNMLGVDLRQHWCILKLSL
jgi:hypothetical protein